MGNVSKFDYDEKISNTILKKLVNMDLKLKTFR